MQDSAEVQHEWADGRDRGAPRHGESENLRPAFSGDRVLTISLATEMSEISVYAYANGVILLPFYAYS